MVSCTSVHAAANQIQVAAIVIPSDNPENTVKPGDQITIALTFQNNLTNIESVSTLQIKIGANGETKTLSELRDIDYEYEASFWGTAKDDFAKWYKENKLDKKTK